MKSGVAAFVQACKEAEAFQGRLSILLTSDEEGDATYGTQIMLAHLKEIGLLPDYCVVAEPTCEERFGDAIKIGRRGSINGYLMIKGRQGHAAYPEKAVNLCIRSPRFWLRSQGCLWMMGMMILHQARWSLPISGEGWR